MPLPCLCPRGYRYRPAACADPRDGIGRASAAVAEPFGGPARATPAQVCTAVCGTGDYTAKRIGGEVARISNQTANLWRPEDEDLWE